MNPRAKYCVILALLGGASFVAVPVLWDSLGWGALLLAWVGISFLVLSAAYVWLGPGVLGKRADGTMHPASFLLFAPYHLLNALTFHLYRSISRKPPLLRVSPQVVFGRRLTGREALRLGIAPDAAVLDLTAEFMEPRGLRTARAYRCLPILDAAAPTSAQLREAVQWLRQMTADGPAYVHCALGNERSATVVVAWLLATGEASSIDEALSRLQSQRPAVRLHPEQRQALKVFQDGTAN